MHAGNFFHEKIIKRCQPRYYPRYYAMSILTFLLPMITDIVSLYSNIKLECSKHQQGNIEEEHLIESVREMKEPLVRKTQELVETVKVLGAGNGELVRGCLDLSRRINSQSRRIRNALEPPVNFNEALQGLEEVNSHISILGSTLCSHYDEMAAKWEKENILVGCYKRTFQSIRSHPPPVFESEIEEYSEIVDTIRIEYPEPRNERLSLNRKILRFPGIVPFLMSLVDARKRNRLLDLIKEYSEDDHLAINPFPNEVITLLPCVKVLDLGFSSEEELRQDFVRFFKNGNWLEAYVYFMLDRAGCSTRLMNINLRCGDILLEVDVLALFRNRLFVFESKDRSNSDGLTENDLPDIEEQLDKISRTRDVEVIYVISSKDEHQDTIKSQIEEIASSKGVQTKILFLDNTGIDNLATKIRESIR